MGMTELLELVRDVLRIAGIAAGLITIYLVYYRALPGQAVRNNAGRISAFVVLWLCSWLAKLVSTSADMLLVTAILVQTAGLTFCAVIWSIYRTEKNGHAE